MRNITQLKTVLTVVVLAICTFGCSKLGVQQNSPLNLVVEIDPNEPANAQVTADTVSILKHRLDALGLPNVKVSLSDPTSRRIQVSIPAASDVERIKNLITSVGKLEIVHVLSPPSPAPPATYESKEEAIAAFSNQDVDFSVLPFPQTTGTSDKVESTHWVAVEMPPIVFGTDLRNARAVAIKDDEFHIAFSLTPEGGQNLAAWTKANINQYVGVVLNNEIKSIAYIKSPLSDAGEISGRFTKQHAEDLAQILNSGPLPVTLRILEERKN
jgi:preprotein translocase subunit SecD